ncbi:iron transporter [Halorarius litoreus]|uniref:iron transporter n=1 Tax=Halorarius litoreus TaxID=2962676 RepID=UPI0020CEC84A|nr:iron transporter [Halorarius litoreus]
MRRRAFLTAAGWTVTATAGCLGRASPESYTIPPALDDPPTQVYVPTHGTGLDVVGTADAGPFRLGLLYSYPDRFWEVTGRKRYLRAVEPEDSIHLMATAWDPKTGIVLPEVGLTVEVARDGELVAQEAVYAMLSQRLGFHYGDNFALPGDGRYEVTVRVGGLQLRRTGGFEGRFTDPASTTFTLDYRRAERDGLSTTRPDTAGAPGAMEPANALGIPNAEAPTSLPGESLGRATVDDTVFAFALLSGDEAERFDADRYLVVSPRTPYNGMLLPSMGLRVRIDRAGGSVETILTRTVDSELGYHYGTVVPALDSGDTLVVETLTPPQVARHEGYETAFIELPALRHPVP